MTTADLTALLDRLRAEPLESEWLEFKATRLDSQPLGEYLSARLSGCAEADRQ